MNVERKDFLINMYNQMFNDINRHIMVVWQSIGVVVGAFALLSLVEKNIVRLDIAVSLIVLLTAWFVAHLLDASYWYNRNLAIIANIERQFLSIEDLKNIHYYFGSHRPENSMITHLKIQFVLGISITFLVLFYHFTEQIIPGFSSPLSHFDPMRAIPYFVLLASFFYVREIHKKKKDNYAEFLRNSPGISIDTRSVVYGPGHGHSDVAQVSEAPRG